MEQQKSPVNQRQQMINKKSQQANQNNQVPGILNNCKSVGEAMHKINCSPIKFHDSDDYANLYAEFNNDIKSKKCTVEVPDEQ